MASRVVIAGATGFVGRALAESLKDQYSVVGLTRGHKRTAGIEWRSCDLFSLTDAERALEGADYAYYLVHSMMPSARLTQGNFRDMDLIVADNFARAAQKNGVKQIIYLGGLVPAQQELSQHLTSRLEVEQTLRASGVPVTALRAGIVLGAAGSSFQILVRLVRRLPFMVVPKWTLHQTSPIAHADAIQYLKYCLGRPECHGQAYDIACPDALCYRDMLRLTAEHLGLKRRMVPLPVLTPNLSRLWVTLITGAPKTLAKPLIESLKSPMVAVDRRLEAMSGIHPMNFEQALAESFAEEADATTPVAFTGRRKSVENTVRSVQRLPLPPGGSVDWMAQEYLRWLPRFIPHFIRVEVDRQGHCEFYFKLLRIKLLTLYLNLDRSHPDLRYFDISEGHLVLRGPNGNLEFRRVLGQDCVLSAIHDFQPRLPWFVYVFTQAKVHLWVMRAFGKHLRRLREHYLAKKKPQEAA